MPTANDKLNAEPSREGRILIVDDDRGLLAACERQLRGKFNVETANGGEAALAKIASGVPCAVLLTDREMPGMDGVQLLSQVRARWPDTVRMMLTGNADLALVVRLVNENNIFRFLTKPCPIQFMVKALEDALRFHQLAVAEKELLNQTLKGSIKLLTDILSMAGSPSFSQSRAVQEAITGAAQQLGLDNAWEINLAVMLGPISTVTVPPETLVRQRSGQALSSAEEQMLADLPEAAARLLRNIPRLQGVAQIVRYQKKSFDGAGFPPDGVAGEQIPLGSRLLKIILDLNDLERGGVAKSQALAEMRQRKGVYDPALLGVIQQVCEGKSSSRLQGARLSIAVSAKDLSQGMVLRSNLETKEGALILPAGHEIDEMTLEKIRNFATIVGVKEPVLVESLEAPA